MATYTTNYGLEKPDASDEFRDFRTSYNSNMDVIDANLGGGGGGADVVHLTQAQYDALPSSKLTDDKLYLITDAGGGGGGGTYIVEYSTTEKKVGTWIDGSDLFQKTLQIPATDITNHSHTDADLTNADMIQIVSGFYEVQSGGGTITLALNQFEATNYYTRTGVRSDKTVYLYATGYTANGAIVTVQYTKTP